MYDVLANASQNCTEWDITTPGLGCQQFANSHGVELDQFTSWNIDVGAMCEHFSMGTQYCNAVPGFRQSGIVSTCNQFAMANDSNWADQPCQILEIKFGLSHARFVAWNPALGVNCTRIYPFYDYCVSIPGYKPTYSTLKPTASTTASIAKSNTLTSTTTGTKSSATKVSTVASTKSTSDGVGVSKS